MAKGFVAGAAKYASDLARCVAMIDTSAALLVVLQLNATDLTVGDGSQFLNLFKRDAELVSGFAIREKLPIGFAVVARPFSATSLDLGTLLALLHLCFDLLLVGLVTSGGPGLDLVLVPLVVGFAGVSWHRIE